MDNNDFAQHVMATHEAAVLRGLVIQRLILLDQQVPWKALAAVCDALEEGRAGKWKDNPEEWRTISRDTHWSHAYMHYQQIGWTDNDSEEDDIAHYTARSLMCAERLIEERTP